jgi:hypothetical protein
MTAFKQETGHAQFSTRQNENLKRLHDDVNKQGTKNVFVGKKKNILESLHESGVVLPAEKCFHLHGQLQRWWILESLDHELALALHDQRPGQEDSGACVYYMRMIHAHVYYI